MIAEITELAVPNVRGEGSGASAAYCLLAVCEYFGCETHGGGAFESLLERADLGATSLDDIAAAAQDLGLNVSAGPLTLDQLSVKISAGMPVIADLDSTGHYVVAFGLATAGLLIMDPVRGHDVLPLDAWPGEGIVLDMPGAERQTQDIERELHPHEALAHHYADVWNALHDAGEQVPHWELQGAHENLSGTDWHVDLGHDGEWRPLHYEDMQRVYLWPTVEKGHGGAVEKAKRRKPNPQQGLFGNWVDASKPPTPKHPQSSESFEGMHPRRGQGSGGGRFSKINTGTAPGQQSLFGVGGYEERAPKEPQREAALPATTTGAVGASEGTHHSPKGGVTLAGHFFVGGQFIPNEVMAEATPAEKQNLLVKQHAQLKQAEHELGEPEHPKAAAKVQETRERKLAEASADITHHEPAGPTPGIEPHSEANQLAPAATTSIDKPEPLAQNVPEPPKLTEEPHAEQSIVTEARPGPGGLPESERGGNTSGSASGNAGGERPRPAGPRIVTARAEHTQAGNPELVPASVRGHLNEAQQQGTALAINAMTKYGGFLLADGTGLGKTRQQLAVAQHFLDQGRKVVIVSPAEVIKPDWKKSSMSGSFANDSAVMGVPVKLAKGDGKIEPGSAHITTYNELGKLKDQIDKNTVVIFDESHFMKNRDSARFKHGSEVMDKAAAVLYATATPGDKPLHIAHLVRAGVFGNVGKTETYQRLGMRLVDQHIGGGRYQKVWQIDPQVGYKEAARRLSGLFDQMTKDGLMVKRELAMDHVHFRADRVTLKDEEHEAVKQAYQQKLDETRSTTFPNGNKAVALMTARMRQEPFKIPATVSMVQEELAAGRSPIIFLGRVNDIVDEDENKGEGEGEISFGTAGKLKEALLAAGIPAEQIGELHGAATKTPDAKKKAMNHFQEGKTRVMIATVQSGGTGINLDDTTGERPRTVIMMTPPFTANDMAQAIGRVHRLNTKSDSKVRGVLADTHIDDWNAGILENKFRTLGAVVGGESTRGQAAYVPPEGLEEEENKGPFAWDESLKSQPKVYHNTPFAHNDIIGQFGGKRVNRGGEWTTQFPSGAHLDHYRQHVAPKPAPQSASPTVAPSTTSPRASPGQQEQPAAEPMSEAHKEAIHQGLRQLHAANQDRASQRNGEGFNKMDSDFGGQLAEQSSLTDRQAAAAARMLAKYKRQLGDELHGKITTLEKPETTSSPSPPTAFDPIAHVPALTAAVRQHGGSYNHASMVQIRHALVENGVSDRAQQDAVINAARRQGLVSASAIEGRHGVTPEEQAAALREGEDRLGHLALREEAPSAPAPRPSSPILSPPPSAPASRPPSPPPPSVAIKRVQTKRGARSVHSFAPTESFWQARKAGKIPSNVTVFKDPRSGRWEASVWGADDREIHDTLAQLRERGVRL